MNKRLTVIGGGPGGYAAAIMGAKLGLDVTLIEKEKLGGTCLNVGCIPTKAFSHSAELYKNIKESEMFGIKSGVPEVDFKQVQVYKNMVVDQLVGGVKHLVKLNKINLINGFGRIVSQGQVAVDTSNGSETIETDYIIIATGSEIIDIPGMETNGTNILNSTDILSMDTVPESLTVIGGGVIGVEFASIFSRFGTKVNIVELMDRIIPTEDKEVSQTLNGYLKKGGVRILTGSKVTDIENKGETVSVVVEKGQEKEVIESEKVLVCIGRKSNFDNIFADGLDIAVEKGRILTDSSMKTNIDGIYAIGDVTTSEQLAHVAYAEARVAVQNIAGTASAIDYRAVPHCIFTDPEVSSVGLTEEAAKNKYENVKVSKFPFIGNGKALITAHPDGFVKLIVNEATGDILGASIIGPKATELIAEICLAVNTGLKVDDIIETIHAHPTLSEALSEVSLSSVGLNLHS